MANGESDTFIENLLAEHRRVDSRLREAWSAVIQCSGPDVDASPADVALVLRRVRDDLARHFAEEEAGGCLEEAVTKCPRFSPDETRILSEHSELLGRLDSLIDRVATAFEGTAQRHAFEIDFGDFFRRVHAHEAAENELIRQALGAVIDAENCAQSPETTDF